MPANADWGKVLGCDDTLAGALIDRLVHHSRVLNLKGESYRLRSRTPGMPTAVSKPRRGVGPS